MERDWGGAIMLASNFTGITKPLAACTTGRLENIWERKKKFEQENNAIMNKQLKKNIWKFEHFDGKNVLVFIFINIRLSQLIIILANKKKPNRWLNL